MSDTITGSTIADRYRVTGLLRPGRMGDIFVARRVPDGARVSVKLLDPALFDNDEAVKRFERESKVTRRLDHPCSMRVLDFGRSTQGPYLVMEYVDGEALSDLLVDGPLAFERAVRVTGLIALALQAAHGIGIVHRDLAPTNVLVASQQGHDVVKVTDFGLSMLTDASDDKTESNLTAVGVRIGTPTYMAPEYIEEYELDHRADLYGLGIMLYEMLVGSPPYVGRPYKVMDAHVNAPIPKPSDKVPGVPGWVDDLVAALMAKSPDDRPQSAADVVQAVESGLGAPLTVVDYISESAPPAPVRTAAPQSDAPSSDPILVRFIQQFMGQVSRGPAPLPDRSKCYVVTDVAPVSIAGELGIAKGWLVRLVGEDEGLLEPRPYHKVVESRAYHCHPPGGGERVTLVTGGIPIGVELMRTVENIEAHYDPLNPDAWALFELWMQEAYKLLEQLSWRTITQQRGPAGILSTGLFARFLGNSDTPKLTDHPALMFHGAATIELDITQSQTGMAEIIDYKIKYASKWPNAYDAVAHYYAAKDKLRAGNKDLAIDLLRQSHALHATRAAEALYDDMTGEALSSTMWVGKVFTDYSMDALESKHSARLSAVCSGMDDAELLVICMMGGFRGSPDYDAFMRRYTTVAAYFNSFFVGLHVVTTATKRDADHPEHYLGEDLARTSGVSFLALHDYRAFVQRAVKPRKLPTIYVINKHGQCVHEGSLEVVDVWTALDRAGRIRFQNLRS